MVALYWLNDLEDLIGTGGMCIIALRAGRGGYEDQNAVDCYIQKEIGILMHSVNKSTEKQDVQPLITSESSVVPENFDHEIPF